MQMRIAITGGTGFIGQYLIERYGNEIDFIVPSSKICTNEYNVKAQYAYTDYSVISFESIFNNCDAVIHLGGNVMKGKDERLCTSDYYVNVELTEKVLCACKNLKIKNVILASSVAVYDQLAKGPSNENSRIQANSVYGIMKVASEQMAEIYNRRYNMNVKILRIGQVLGIRKNLDEKYVWDMFFLKNYRKEEVIIWGHGQTGRDIIYVKDVCDAIICAVRQSKKRGIYNIGTGAVSSNKDIIEAFAKVFDNQNNIIYDLTKQENGIRTCMDIKKAAEELGFYPLYDLNRIAKDMKKEYMISHKLMH